MFKSLLYLVFFLFLITPFNSFFAAEVTQQLQNPLSIYLLPDKHPLKKELDYLFSSPYALQNIDSMKALGFVVKKRGLAEPLFDHKINIAKHPLLPGYRLKFYTSEQKYGDESTNFIARINGARLVKEKIQELNYGKWFKAPEKWLYQIPVTQIPVKNGVQRTFVLVVEDMRIYKTSANRKYWKSIMVDHDLLDRLYTIITAAGLTDSLFLDNIPFSKDRKIAFIDTEHSNKKPINYHRLLNYLTPPMSTYWSHLILQGGPR